MSLEWKTILLKTCFRTTNPKCKHVGLELTHWAYDPQIHKTHLEKKQYSESYKFNIKKDPLKSRGHASMTLNSRMKVFMTSSGLGLPRHQT